MQAFERAAGAENLSGVVRRSGGLSPTSRVRVPLPVMPQFAGIVGHRRDVPIDMPCDPPAAGSPWRGGRRRPGDDLTVAGHAAEPDQLKQPGA